jgi:hypothetical protein
LYLPIEVPDARFEVFTEADHEERSRMVFRKVVTKEYDVTTQETSSGKRVHIIL